jgi:hypothetical protein
MYSISCATSTIQDATALFFNRLLGYFDEPGSVNNLFHVVLHNTGLNRTKERTTFMFEALHFKQ